SLRAVRRQPSFALFPYTTLFRSPHRGRLRPAGHAVRAALVGGAGAVDRTVRRLRRAAAGGDDGRGHAAGDHRADGPAGELPARLLRLLLPAARDPPPAGPPLLAAH